MLNKIISTFLVINKKTKNPSYVLTAFIFGIGVVNFKLLASGISFGDVKMEIFSGTDYAASIVALTSLYVSNKHINNLAVQNIAPKQENTDNVS